MMKNSYHINSNSNNNNIAERKENMTFKDHPYQQKHLSNK